MSREIKFRGLPTGGGWVYGYYFNHSGTDRVFTPNKGSYAVIPESIGQFTGLKDKNGADIYEGDIVITITDKPMVVSWNNKFSSFCLNRDGWAFSHWFGESCNPEDVEVIGNIHENPELLKGGKP